MYMTKTNTLLLCGHYSHRGSAGGIHSGLFVVCCNCPAST